MYYLFIASIFILLPLQSFAVSSEDAVAFCEEAARNFRSCAEDKRKCGDEGRSCLQYCDIETPSEDFLFDERQDIKKALKFCTDNGAGQEALCLTAKEALSSCDGKEACDKGQGACLKACEYSDDEVKQCKDIYATKMKPKEKPIVAEEDPDCEADPEADGCKTEPAAGDDELSTASTGDDPPPPDEDPSPETTTGDVYPDDEYYPQAQYPTNQGIYGNPYGGFGNNFGQQNSGPQTQFNGAQVDLNGGLGDGRIRAEQPNLGGGSANIGAIATDDRFPFNRARPGFRKPKQQAGAPSQPGGRGGSPAAASLGNNNGSRARGGRRRRRGFGSSTAGIEARKRAGVGRVSTKGGLALMPTNAAATIASADKKPKKKKARGKKRKRKNGALALLAKQENIKGRFNNSMRSFRLRGNLVNYDGKGCASMVFCNMEGFFGRQDFRQGREPASSDINPANFK